MLISSLWDSVILIFEFVRVLYDLWVFINFVVAGKMDVYLVCEIKTKLCSSLFLLWLNC